METDQVSLSRAVAFPLKRKLRIADISSSTLASHVIVIIFTILIILILTRGSNHHLVSVCRKQLKLVKKDFRFFKVRTTKTVETGKKDFVKDITMKEVRTRKKDFSKKE